MHGHPSNVTLLPMTKVTVLPMTVDQALVLADVRALVRTGAARDLRKRADLSLGDVARAVGVSPTTVLRWERAEAVPTGAAAVQYALLLGRLRRRQRRTVAAVGGAR